MNEEKLLSRIEINPEIMVGKPIIKGTRLTVIYIMKLLASDSSIDEILQEYPDLTKEDILACIAFSTQAIESAIFVPL